MDSCEAQEDAQVPLVTKRKRFGFLRTLVTPTGSPMGMLWRLPTTALLASLLLGTAGLTVASGTQAGATHPPANITRAMAIRQYKALASAINPVITKFNAESQGWSAATPRAQGVADAKPMITAFQKFGFLLLAERWPSADEADIKTVAKDVIPIIGDLRAIGQESLGITSTFTANFDRDLTHLSAGLTLVNKDFS